MSEAITKTVTGTCGKIEESGGFTSFHIDVEGWEHPIRISTKLDPLIELGRAASKEGAPRDWTYTEKQGKENPHRPGTFYMDRYLSGVMPAGTSPESAQTRTTPDTAPKGYSPDLKDRMIVRQTALKAAAEIVGPRAATTVDPDYDAAKETIAAASRFETWVYRDIDEPPFD